MVHIYCLDITNKIPKVVLPRNVATHVNKYRNAQHKKVSLLCWSTLMDLLQTKYKIDFKKDKICFEKNDKPYLKSKKLFFSLSHSGNLIAIAISNKNIGLDIQELIDLKMCDMFVNKILNKKQIKQYQKSKNKSLFLTKLWTQKEALLKLKGLTILDIRKIINARLQDHTFELCDSKNKKYILSYAQ